MAMKLRPSIPSARRSGHWPSRCGAVARRRRHGAERAGHRRDAAQPGRRSPAICSPRCPGRRRTAGATPPTPSARAPSRCSPIRTGVGAAWAATSAVPVLVHPDPRSVLGELAATVYGNPSERLRVIGVTGTSGKTTTTYLVEAGLRAAERVAGLIGTVGIRIDGRRSAQRADHTRGARSAGAAGGDGRTGRRHRGDGGVQPRADAGPRRRRATSRSAASPTCRATTSTSTRRWQDYFDAKARLFDPGSPTHAGASVVCIDDDAGRAMAARRARSR